MGFSSKIKRLKLEIEEPRVPKHVQALADSLKQIAVAREWGSEDSNNTKSAREKYK